MIIQQEPINALIQHERNQKAACIKERNWFWSEMTKLNQANIALSDQKGRLHQQL
jgi:hypothetical protein